FAFMSGIISFPTAKSMGMLYWPQIARWALMGRSEQLPITTPFAWALLTISMVRIPGGSPTSKVPSMSKLIRITTSVPLSLQGGCRAFTYESTIQQSAGEPLLLETRRPPLALVRLGAHHDKVAAQRHGTARDSDLRLDPGDLSRSRPSLQLLDAIRMHPKTAAAAPDVAATG